MDNSILTVHVLEAEELRSNESEGNDLVLILFRWIVAKTICNLSNRESEN